MDPVNVPAKFEVSSFTHSWMATCLETLEIRPAILHGNMILLVGR